MIALAGLGVPAGISGKIGADTFGATYGRQVAAYGVTSRLVTGNGMTGSSIILDRLQHHPCHPRRRAHHEHPPGDVPGVLRR